MVAIRRSRPRQAVLIEGALHDNRPRMIARPIPRDPLAGRHIGGGLLRAVRTCSDTRALALGVFPGHPSDAERFQDEERQQRANPVEGSRQDEDGRVIVRAVEVHHMNIRSAGSAPPLGPG